MSDGPHPLIAQLDALALAQEAHMASMPAAPAALDAWVVEMTRRHGSTVIWWHLGQPQWRDLNDLTGETVHDLRRYAPGWLKALLIAMYGESPDHWPPAWSDTEVQRANLWMRGGTPRGVMYAGMEN